MILDDLNIKLIEKLDNYFHNYDDFDIERDYDKDEILDDYFMTAKDNFANYDSWKTNDRY